MRISRNEAGAGRRQGLSLVAAAALLAGGYVAGKMLDGEYALADPPKNDKDAHVLLDIEKIPGVGAPTGGFAVVGAANNKYYIVNSEGVARPVYVERHARAEGRADLFWK